MKLICFDVHYVICCCKEWSFQVFADHRDSSEDDSLLVLSYYNPLGMLFRRSIKNLELNQVKFKIRGGLLGILLSKNSADCFC